MLLLDATDEIYKTSPHEVDKIQKRIIVFSVGVVLMEAK